MTMLIRMFVRHAMFGSVRKLISNKRKGSDLEELRQVDTSNMSKTSENDDHASFVSTTDVKESLFG